jgi:ADP-ribose pyrophosphatase
MPRRHPEGAHQLSRGTATDTPGAPAPDPRASPPHLVERFVRGEQVFKGKLLDVRRDVVAMPDGAHATREYVVHPGAVVIVPVLDDGRLVIERQYRYPVGRTMLEFPAGKLDHGEPPLECALRELTEETGYRAGQWAVAGVLHNAIGYSTEVIHIVFARALVAGARSLDDGELIDLVLMTEAELDDACAHGDITDAKTLIALLWLQKWRTGTWTLQWFSAP